MSKLQARMLMVFGCVACALVAVLQYTLFEYSAAWLALGAFGVAGISVGLYHIWSRVLAVLVGAVLLAAACYGAGFLIASSAASLFAWSAR